MLTEHNADINIRNHFGMSPLHVAANRTTSTNRNHVNTNSSWEKPGYGTTKGTVEGTRLLLKHGAIQDAEDNEGMTPLLLALKHGCHDTATCLKDGEMEHPHIFGRSDGYIGSLPVYYRYVQLLSLRICSNALFSIPVFILSHIRFHPTYC